MRKFLFAGCGLAFVGPVFAASSYVLPDGLGRAPASVLHCVTQGGNAAPCGTSVSPLYVTGGSGIIVVPVGGNPVSRSLSVSAQQSVTLFPINPYRRYLAFQAPQGSGIWVNLVGGPAAPNGVDCVYFAPGTFYETGNFVNRNAVSVYSPVAATISAVEG